MSNQRQETELGKALFRTAEDYAGTSSVFTKEKLYNLALAHTSSRFAKKQNALKLRFAFYILPAAALLALVFFTALPKSKLLQHNSTAYAVKDYIEYIMPAQVNWVHDSIIGSVENSYIDDYVETIINVENSSLYF